MPDAPRKINPPHFNPPLDIVGGSNFGRSPKINASRTYNMIISDGFLVDSYGYVFVGKLGVIEGRSIFGSTKGNFLLAVVDNIVYRVTVAKNINIEFDPVSAQKVGEIGSFSGGVFIADNDVSQMAICDKSRLYIYNYATNVFEQAVLPSGVIPGYVIYKNSSFIIVDLLTNFWYISEPGDGLNWFWGPSGTPVQGAIQTKPDLGVAVISIPGAGNNILVMGHTVGEPWTNVPSTLFPYQRSTSSNIDYGCISSETIATLDNLTVWLSGNETSGPVISALRGGSLEQISTDGYNFRFSQLTHPQMSCAFFIRIAGHLLYQLTFYHPDDNFSLIYDFTTQQFFDATDENLDHHIFRDVARLDGRYYGVSLNDGNIYQLDEKTYVYDYGPRGNFEKPRIRITSNIRALNNFRFCLNRVTILIEQGNDPNIIIPEPSYQPRVEMAVSKNGGYDYSYTAHRELQRLGKRQNITRFDRLGSGNEFVLKFRFRSKGPINVGEGLADIWQ